MIKVNFDFVFTSSITITLKNDCYEEIKQDVLDYNDKALEVGEGRALATAAGRAIRTEDVFTVVVSETILFDRAAVSHGQIVHDSVPGFTS